MIDITPEHKQAQKLWIVAENIEERRNHIMFAKKNIDESLFAVEMMATKEDVLAPNVCNVNCYKA